MVFNDRHANRSIRGRCLDVDVCSQHSYILRRKPSSYTGYALVSPGVYLAWKLRGYLAPLGAGCL